MTSGQTFALVFLLGSGLLAGLLALVARSDIGQAIADAIRHNSGANEGAAVRRELEEMRSDLERVTGELEEVQQRLLESGERLDFAERLLARGQGEGVPTRSGEG